MRKKLIGVLMRTIEKLLEDETVDHIRVDATYYGASVQFPAESTLLMDGDFVVKKRVSTRYEIRDENNDR